MIIPGATKLNSTVLIISAPREKNNIRIITPCEHRESTLYSQEDPSGKIISARQVFFTAPCSTNYIYLGDDESVFTDTNYALPFQTSDEIEKQLINTHTRELLDLMRSTPD